MKLYDAGIVFIAIILVVTLIGRQAHRWSDAPHHTGNPAWEGHDSPAEESLEEVHYVLTGESVDFTPLSPEADA
jgi:hypothetical protein